MAPSEYAREVLLRFAQRAFRGSESDRKFMDLLHARYLRHREEGLTQFQALLEPLMEVARNGELTDPEELRNQNTRLLNDLPHRRRWQAHPPRHYQSRN